jgi:signal peptidase I
MNQKIQSLVNKTELSDSIKQIYSIEYQNQFYSDFISQLSFWQNKARFAIAESKRTWSGSVGMFIDHDGIVYRPVDKRENYIKRCVAVAGQYIEIKNAVLYVNDKPAKVAPNQNRLHLVSGSIEFTIGELFKKFQIEKSDLAIDSNTGQIYGIHCNDQMIEKLSASYPKTQFTLYVKPQPIANKAGMYMALDQLENIRVFPKDPNVPNTTFSKSDNIPNKVFLVTL